MIKYEQVGHVMTHETTIPESHKVLQQSLSSVNFLMTLSTNIIPRS